MAQRSRGRAAKLAPPGAQLVGLGATAGLVTDRPRQGEHRCYIAVATGAGTDVHSIVLAKGRRDRPAEEDLVARAIVLCLARGCGVDAPSPRVLLDADERYAEAAAAANDPIDRIVAGSLDRVTAWPDGQQVQSAPPARVLRPRALHAPHAPEQLPAPVAAGTRALARGYRRPCAVRPPLHTDPGEPVPPRLLVLRRSCPAAHRSVTHSAH